MSQSDERLFSMLIYVLSFFTTIFGPLIIWLMKREDSELMVRNILILLFHMQFIVL